MERTASHATSTWSFVTPDQLALLECSLTYLTQRDFSRNMLHDTFIFDLFDMISMAYYCTRTIAGQNDPPRVRVSPKYDQRVNVTGLL